MRQVCEPCTRRVHCRSSPPLPCQQGPDLGIISVEEYSISIMSERESPCQGP